MNLNMVPDGKLIPDPDNPRTDVDSVRNSAFAASVKKFGVKVPLIGYVTPGGIMVCDGHRRLEAARLAGIPELPVIIFPQKPSAAEFLTTQLTIGEHRAALNPVDEYEAFTRLAKLKDWSASELAAGLAVSNAEITRVMAIGKLSPDEQQLVREGKISKSAAYALSRMSPDQRVAVIHKVASGEVTRDQLSNQVRRRKEGDDVKKRRINCRVTGGIVSVQADEGLDLSRLVEMLDGLLRECRKLRTQGLNIATAVHVLNDPCKAPSAA